MIINYFLILGFALDLILTYKYLKIYAAKFPDKDFTVIESNPLIRFTIKQFGVGHGVAAGGVIILGILIILLKLLPVNWKFFLAGVYYMMVTFHLTNFLALKRMQGGEIKNGN